MELLIAKDKNASDRIGILEPTCALMHRFLSVCLSVTLLKIHISESIIGRGLKLYHSIKPLYGRYIWETMLLYTEPNVTDCTLRKIHISKWLWYYCCDR